MFNRSVHIRPKTSEKMSLKVIIVGDGAVGKTCILYTFVHKTFPSEHEPTIFENHSCSLMYKDKEYNMTLWDTAGQEEYEKIRKLSYPGTKCVIMCYSVENRNSYENIFHNWYPEIRAYLPGASIVLVGTKLDLRKDSSKPFTKTGEGEKLKRKIGAVDFVECSAKDEINIDKIFEAAIKAIVEPKRKSCCFCCNLL